MLTLGIDIGGVNTKATLFKDRDLEKNWIEHIPLWKEFDSLEEFLEELETSSKPTAVGVTMTGELCDVFESRQKGVEKIVRTVEETFRGRNVHYLSLSGDFISGRKAMSSPKKVSAANWVASGLLVGKEYPDCLLIDVGSTTTDLIPIKNGRPDPDGWTDFERLKVKELIYTGVLRTPPPFLKDEVNIGGNTVGLASEYFANMGDIYRTLELLEEDEYTCDTPDGRGKGREECMKRIARVLCSDLEEMGEKSVIKVARRFRQAQIQKVRKGLLEMSNLHEIGKRTPVVVTGVGSEILAREAAEEASFERIIELSEIYGEVSSRMTPAFSLGLLVSEVINT